jgi:hypothetical protein
MARQAARQDVNGAEREGEQPSRRLDLFEHVQNDEFARVEKRLRCIFVQIYVVERISDPDQDDHGGKRDPYVKEAV